jgi:hypothetical protein
LYTDGLTESKNLDDEEFGTARVEELLREHHDLPVEDLIIRLHEEVKRFSGQEEADDDITLIVMRLGTRAEESLKSLAQEGASPMRDSDPRTAGASAEAIQQQADTDRRGETPEP